MRKIRIGNDIAVQWSLVAKGTGEPFVVEGKDIRLTLKSIFAKTAINEFDVAGNTISWTFKGAEQKQVGIYSLEVSLLDEQGVMITTDVCDFVELVACSCEIGGMDATGVHTESIELISDVDVAAGIDLSAYLTKTEAQTTYQPQEKGKGLSTNDYTTAEKNKLDGLQNYDDTGIRQELTELSAEVSGLSEKIENLPSGDSSVFEAVHGETTYDEVVEAKNAGKFVICIKDRLTYHLSYVSEDLAYFTTIKGNVSYATYINKTTNKWTDAIYTLEQLANKVTSLSESSTDTQYPSAKAVFTAIGKKSEVSLEALANGNLKVTIDGESKDFMPATPSGDPMHYAYIEAGAEYDEETKLWRYGGKDVYHEYRYIEGLTTKEVADAYRCMPSFAQITPIKGQWSNNLFRPRFVFCMLAKSGISIDAAFQENTSLEFVDFRRDAIWTSAIYTFYGCTNLHTIHQRIYINGATGQNAFLSTFQGCKNLQNIKLFQLAKSIDFKDSSLLTNASILYMVSNSAASSAIVITLHADAYARAMADTEIQAALASHPNVSLASA